VLGDWHGLLVAQDVLPVGVGCVVQRPVVQAVLGESVGHVVCSQSKIVLQPSAPPDHVGTRSA